MAYDHCQRNKLGKTYGKIFGSLHKETPLNDISSGVYDPFDGNPFMHTFEENMIYAICITDRVSRYTKIKFSNKITSQDFIGEECIPSLKKPITLLTDQGKCYKGKITDQFCKRNSIKQIFSAYKTLRGTR